MKPTTRFPSRFSFGANPTSQRADAFALVDLIIGTAVGIVLIGSIGGLALMSELRFNRESELNQALRNSWSRSLAFISNEAQQAYWISNVVSLPTGYPCPGAAPDNPLVLDGPPNPANPAYPLWRVVYGTRTNEPGSNQWRGVNRLVRCGPPFERLSRDNTPQQTRTDALRAAAVGGNLSFSDNYQETFIADQLSETATIPCPLASIPGPCRQPFQVRLFNTSATRDRDAQVNLFLRRGSGPTYPPNSNTGFHVQIRASRNQGVDATSGNPNCTTQTDTFGNQVPTNTDACQIFYRDTSKRRNLLVEHHLKSSTGDFRINGCGPTCDAARLLDVTEIVYMQGLYDDFTIKQFSAGDTRPCSRKSCYLKSAKQSLQIFDGNLIVFNDRMIRL